MKQLIFACAAAGLLASCAGAQTRRSTRNLKPLTKQWQKEESATQAGNTGMDVATPQREQQTKVTYTFHGPTSGWGMLKESGPHYSPQGKNLGRLPGGTLFKYSDVKQSSKNAMLVVTLKKGDAWDGPYLIDCTDVAVYEGSPETIDPEIISNLTDYFALNGKLQDRKAELTKQAATSSPHYAAATELQAEMKASIAKAAQMEKEMNALTGAQRSKKLEELRVYKYEQAQLKTKMDKSVAEHKAWQEKNPLPDATLLADPQVKTLSAELAQLAPKVANLIPADDAP